MGWRDVVRDMLPDKLVNSVEYDCGALIGDDMHAHGLSELTIIYAALASFTAFLLAWQLERLRVLGVSGKTRREVATRLTDAIRLSAGAERPVVATYGGKTWD